MYMHYVTLSFEVMILWALNLMSSWCGRYVLDNFMVIRDVPEVGSY